MENGNVEYNEVKCKNLILGDEETGFINLKVSKIDDSPAIEINPNDGNEDSSIRIGFKDGRPILSLTSHDADKKKNTICFTFNDQGMPTFELITNVIDEDNFDSGFAVGFSEGQPLLGLISKQDEHTSIASLYIDEDVTHFVLSNRSKNGGFISMKVDSDDSSIVIRDYEELTDETESQKKNKGIYLINNSEVTLIDVNGQVIGGRNIQKEKSPSEGESNE